MYASLTTAVVCMLDDDNVLSTVNVGDSGFLVVRDGRLVYASEPQEHAPNTPFQLGTDSIDTPKDGTTVRLRVAVGDVIIVGSDDEPFRDMVMKRLLARVEERRLSHGPGTTQIVASNLGMFGVVRGAVVPTLQSVFRMPRWS